MASVLKAQRANAFKLETKAKGKRKADDMDVDEEPQAPPAKKKNKQRVLLLSSRGITHRMRHLMNDLEALLPHVKKGEVLASLWSNIRNLLLRARFETRLKISTPPPSRTSRPK